MLAYQAARQAADAVRVGFATTDPYEICARLGVSVVTSDLPRSTSGLIVKEANEDARIYLSSADPETRRRFTCAHELGHFVERVQYAEDDEFSFIDARGAKYDLHEFFADEFAGALLMPAEDIRALGSNATPIFLAARFGVSVAAAEKRLQRLKRNPT